MSFAALVLAGTRPEGDPLARELGVAHKGLIELAGLPLLARVVEGLNGAGAARVLVACDEGPVADLARRLGCEVCQAHPAGPSASVRQAFAATGAPLVVTTVDHALLRPEWVRQLLADTPAGADLAVMLAERARVEAAVPGTRRTWLRFADGHWSGCNLFHLSTPAAVGAIDLWQRIEADRKRPWRIVTGLGPGTLLAYAFGRLTLAEGLARLGRRIGLEVALVAARDGRAAVDVDKPGDLADVRRLLAR